MMLPPIGHSGPSASQRASGATLESTWGLRASPSVPKVPPGTSGQSLITPATSVVPHGVSLENPLPMGLISMSERAFSVSLPALVPAGFQEKLEPQAFPLLHFQAMVPEVRTFFANLSGNPPSSKASGCYPD